MDPRYKLLVTSLLLPLNFKLNTCFVFVFLLTPQTAACNMASKPPSGASRLPDILSFWSSSVKKFKSLVSLMTFWKENGGSLLGHGWESLRRWKEDRQKKRKKKCHLQLDYTSVLTFFNVLMSHFPSYFMGLMSVWGSITLSTNFPNPMV